MKKKLLLGAIATLGLLSLTGCGKSAEVDSKNILEMDEVKISAQEFFDDIKENYVQIDEDKLIRKDMLDIDSIQITKIKNDLLFYLDSFGDIDSTEVEKN